MTTMTDITIMMTMTETMIVIMTEMMTMMTARPAAAAAGVVTSSLHTSTVWILPMVSAVRSHVGGVSAGTTHQGNLVCGCVEVVRALTVHVYPNYLHAWLLALS